MTPLVPQKIAAAQPGSLSEDLYDLLHSALEFIGAAAGWIGLQDAGGRLAYPVRAGAFSESWLTWQHDHGGIWGLAVGEEPALLNDVQPWSKLLHPPLRNLLSCPLIHNHRILGHVVLANKANGFTAQDSVVLQGMAHHMARLLGRRAPDPSAPIELPAPWRRILDQAREGILILDEFGVLIYTNATWIDWTGFPPEELVGRTAPFPFWVSQQDLVRALSMASTVPASLLPFRRRDRSLFWCRLETLTERWDEHTVTVSFLQSATEPPPPLSDVGASLVTAAVEQTASLRSPMPDWLPLLLDLDDGIEGWSARWEELTGLSSLDADGSRYELVLDWLFPQQLDRDRVTDCFHQPRSIGFQLLLEVAAVSGNRPMMCTFLPLPARASNAVSHRWLLLLGEPIAEATNHDGSNHHDPAVPIILPDQSEPRP